MKHYGLAVMTALSLGMVGCSGGQIVSGVQAVVAATEAVIEALPNIPAPVKSEVTGYLNLASSGVTCVNTELATADTGAARALKIASCFTGLNISALSPQAQAYVTAVNAAIQALLQLFPTSGANTAKLTMADRSNLFALEARNQNVKGRLR